jgi:hypothetical protein
MMGSMSDDFGEPDVAERSLGLGYRTGALLGGGVTWTAREW